MIASDPDENGWIHANDCLVSPPRNWPTSFKANKVLASLQLQVTSKHSSACAAVVVQRYVRRLLARRLAVRARAATIEQRMVAVRAAWHANHAQRSAQGSLRHISPAKAAAAAAPLLVASPKAGGPPPRLAPQQQQRQQQQQQQ